MIEFRILGPLEAQEDGRAVPLRGTRQRALVAVLVLRAGETVATDGLVELLWGEAPPASAVKAISVRVAELRKVLSGVIVTRPGGYALEDAPEQLELRRFEALAAAGRQALALWRGPALADLAFEPFAQSEIPRLEELRLAALEDRAEADLALGRHAQLVGELDALAREHPLRERLRRQLMLALYRCGRQADALTAYRAARHTLVGELGIEPGRELRALEAAILAQDPSLDAPARAPAPAESRPRRTIFVGRDHELEELLADLAGAESGRGRLVLVEGEPGIGKTRLCEELAGRAAERGHTVLVGRCWEAGGAPAYWPWVQSLRGYVRDRDTQMLSGELGSAAAAVGQLVPEVRERLPDCPEPPPLPPEGARFRLFDAVASFLRSAARSRPVLLVLDDLHAADASSLLMLQFVAGELDGSRLMIVGAYRHREVDAGHPLAATLTELARCAGTRLLLDGLSRPAVADYIEACTGASAPESLVAAVHRGSDGNPLFLAELVRMLGDAELRRESVPARFPIPPGVRATIAVGLRRLSADCRALLETASALGREFALAPLERVAGVTGATLLERLGEAITAEVVSEVPGARGRLRFSHALVRDVLYDELGPARRARLHHEIAEALVALHARELDPHLAEIAHHYAEAAPSGDRGPAVAFARRAGDRAGRLLAYEEAARLYRLALDALDEATGDREACELMLALGEAEARAGDLAAARRTLLRAAELARGLRDSELLARAALGYGGRLVWVRADDELVIPLLEEALTALGDGQDELRVRVLTRLCGALRREPSRRSRFELSEEAVERARRAGDPATLAYALEGRYCVLYDSPSAPPAAQRAVAEEMTHLALVTGDRERAVHGRFGRLVALLETGDVAAAKSELRAMQALADSLRQPAQRWIALASGAAMALFEGDFAAGEALIDQSLDVGRDPLRMEAELTARVQRILLHRHQGRTAGLREQLARCLDEHPQRLLVRSLMAQADGQRSAFERLVDALDDTPPDNDWLPSLTLLSELAERLGDGPRSRLLYERLEPYADRNALNLPEIMTGSVSRSLALLAATMSDLTLARRHFDAALEMNASMTARPWHALTLKDRDRVLGRAATVT